MGGELIDETVGQWITERHTQLEHIHTRRIECHCQLVRALEVGIARADISHKALVAGGIQVGKSLLDAVHLAQDVNCRRRRQAGVLPR